MAFLAQLKSTVALDTERANVNTTRNMGTAPSGLLAALRAKAQDAEEPADDPALDALVSPEGIPPICPAICPQPPDAPCHPHRFPSHLFHYFSKIPLVDGLPPDSSSVDPNRRCFTCGNNSYGRLGLGSCSRGKSEPFTPIPRLEGLVVSSASIGAAHSAIVTPDGNLFTWGKCHFGQLGFGKEWMDQFCPRHLPMPEPVAFVACGQSHVLAITQVNGGLYTWGCGYESGWRAPTSCMKRGQFTRAHPHTRTPVLSHTLPFLQTISFS